MRASIGQGDRALYLAKPEEKPEKDWDGQHQDIGHRFKLLLGHFKLFLHNPVFFCIKFLDLFLILGELGFAVLGLELLHPFLRLRHLLVIDGILLDDRGVQSR